jgi:hypothetical protein
VLVLYSSYLGGALLRAALQVLRLQRLAAVVAFPFVLVFLLRKTGASYSWGNINKMVSPKK